MDELSPVYFRPRADPSYTFFLFDTYKVGAEDDNEHIESLKKIFPKDVKLESPNGYLISQRIPIATVISTDPNAYLTINGGRKIKIGVGQFSLPTSCCWATEFKLYHVGSVTIEIRSMEVETEDQLKSVIFNLVFPGNEDGELFAVDNGCLWGPGKAKKPEPQPFDGPTTRQLITELKEVGILFDSP